MQEVVALMEVVDIPEELSGVWDTAIAQAKMHMDGRCHCDDTEIPGLEILDRIAIFDQNTKTLYSLKELEGPFPNGECWQFNIPKSERG